MDELIGQPASKAGCDDVVAENITGLMLGFLRRESPSDIAHALIDRSPGTKASIVSACRGSGLGRLIGSGLMAVGARLVALDPGKGEIQNIARELFRFSQDKIGANHMGEMIAGTPELGQFA